MKQLRLNDRLMFEQGDDGCLVLVHTSREYGRHDEDQRFTKEQTDKLREFLNSKDYPNATYYTRPERRYSTL